MARASGIGMGRAIAQEFRQHMDVARRKAARPIAGMGEARHDASSR